jgi:hypothetical protein
MHENSTASSAQGGELLDWVCKYWEQHTKWLGPSVLPQSLQSSGLCLLSSTLMHLGFTLRLQHLLLLGTQTGVIWDMWKLPSPLVLKLPATNSHSQYIKKWISIVKVAKKQTTDAVIGDSRLFTSILALLVIRHGILSTLANVWLLNSPVQ